MSSRDEIRVLLVRQPDPGFVAQRGFVVVEPLALELLARVCANHGASWLIWDSAVTRETLEEVLVRYRPHLIAMSVVITTIQSARNCAALAKSLLPDVVVCVGGPEPEVNPEFFFQDCFDLVAHSGGVAVFGDVIDVLRLRPQASFAAVVGLWWRGADWVRNPDRALDLTRQEPPIRDHFLQYRDKFHYLGFAGCALVKGSYGCPYPCDFCFCREMNRGRFQQRPIPEIVAEIASLPAELIWLVDDVFAVTGERLREFESEIERQGVNKRFILYLRSDLIVDPELAPTLVSLARKGLFMVLVGLESFSEGDLAAMRKGITARGHENCIQVLRSAGILAVGLFFIPLHTGVTGFLRFVRDLWRSGLFLCTVGVETPFPGTASFERFQKRLITHDLRRWDLLHVVASPQRMPKLLFECLFGLVQIVAAAVCLRSGVLSWGFVKRLLRPGNRLGDAQNWVDRFPDWNFWAYRYERLWVQRVSLGPTRHKMRELLHRYIQEPLRLLDVGCGTGQLLREVQRDYASDHSKGERVLRGIDASSGMIDQCILTSRGIQYRCQSAESLGEGPKAWNAITCTHALPHCADPERVLDLIAASLQPGGVFLLAQATRDTWYDNLALFFVRLTIPKTSNYVSRETIQKWLGKRFEIVETGRVSKHRMTSNISYFVCRPRPAVSEANE